MDFVNVAGPLGVTHFLMVSRSESHVNLRICRLPRGPTITYHVTAVGRAREGFRLCIAIMSESVLGCGRLNTQTV